MEVKFLGVRGSTATPGSEFSKFGGNTSCTEVNDKEFQVILDAGTGFKDVQLRKDVPVIVSLFTKVPLIFPTIKF